MGSDEAVSRFLLSHPTGNANVRAVLATLSAQGALDSFLTTIGVTGNATLLGRMPKRMRVEAERRAYSLLPRQIVDRPHRELVRLLAGKNRRFGRLTQHEVGWASTDAVASDLDCFAARFIRRKKYDAQKRLVGVYCYEDCALQTFQAAKEQGLVCLYDLPIGYWRAGQKIFHEEREREPEWADTLGGLRDSEAKLARKDAEIDMADHVFVASSFTRSTLGLCPTLNSAVPINRVAYGAPQAISQIEFEAANQVRPARDGKLRVLFVGSLGQRKGLSYLLQAVGELKNQVTLTLVGSRPDTICRPLDAALCTHSWIPSLPHAGILAEMQRHDVFVFPSLFEGFGLVLLEAMSRGLPVITTPNTAGPDLLTEGKDGFIVPIRSPDAITARLNLLLEQPERLAEMKRAAWEKARQTTWRSYIDEMTHIFLALIDGID